MPEDFDNHTEMELSRIRHAFWLAIIGLLLATVITIFLVIKGEPDLKSAAEVTAIVGLFTSVTGTLVGAFFGLQIGSAGTEYERRSRQKAEHITRLALSHLDPNVAKDLLQNLDRKP
jgi:hypothetical protein